MIDAEAVVQLAADDLKKVRMGNRVIVADVRGKSVAAGGDRPDVKVVNAGDARSLGDRRFDQ